MTPARPQRPDWHADTHTLWLGNRAVKHYKLQAPLQEVILVAFQEQDWLPVIEFGLPHHEGTNAKLQLRRAVENLNRSVAPLLHFFQKRQRPTARLAPQSAEKGTEMIRKRYGTFAVDSYVAVAENRIVQ